MDPGALRPLEPVELLALAGIPTALNALAARLVIPALDATGALPMEISYFLAVGLLVLAPMFFWALHLSGRERASAGMRGLLARMRVYPLDGQDWAWTILTFLALAASSFLIARVFMPAWGMDAMPFFFRNMPLEEGHRWILAAWPAFFFFNIFGEEFYWRGYVQPRQELLTGRWTWAVQGLLWAAWHLPLGLDLVVASLPIFFLLPGVVQRRGNTSIAILVHAAFGAFGFLALALGAVH